MSRLTLENLLNPVPELDARPQVLALQNLVSSLGPGPILVPPQLHNNLKQVIGQLHRLSNHPEALRNFSTTGSVKQIEVEHNVVINRKTTLSKLYRYPRNTYIEYPETGAEPVGHLFELDPLSWERPTLDFCYSQGAPNGKSLKTQDILCPVLVDEQGDLVPCIKSHSTCQGMKACPYNDIDAIIEPHFQASRKDIERRLEEERCNRLDTSSPKRDLFQRKVAYITTLRNQGCTRSESAPTMRSESEQKEFEDHQDRLIHFRRGYNKAPTCSGRIMWKGDFTISDGSYDLEYLEAVFTNNTDVLDHIENEARLMDYGPRAQCNYLSNAMSQRLRCPTEHRDPDGKLYQAELIHLECKCRFRVFEPVPEARTSFPFLLVICEGAHSHPIPLPEKTPPKIRSEIFKLLESVVEDLPDMTPRAFLRHPVVLTYLKGKFPEVPNPTLSHLHSSLANRSHVDSYIKQAKVMHFPKGTDWKGVLYRKEYQDANMDPKDHYIRSILDLDDNTLPDHEEDEPPNPSHNKRTKIIICMSPEGSRRLRAAQYLQSDIGFKRIVGFMEFELACMDRDANTSVIFCWIYLNRQTAAAHLRIFQEIEAIVHRDTGACLRWRHLHGSDLEDFDHMILHWAADQHRGQAKGLGLHLQALAQKRVGVYDLHEPNRLLSTLSPYDHLYRIFRICVVHVCRRIKATAVSDEVKKLMRSLICISHNNWDETINSIGELGGKPAMDWLSDKLTSRFVFPGICWEKSLIPLAVWQAGDRNSNLIETVHRDVNREGVYCALLGGLMKGQCFDALKMKTLKASLVVNSF
ncbi:hypothetical protein K438DRAFT_1590458 [Mycena galopus ATCC 62051]|nr:hypothetical protein K438DRAFT_1590458 [Mycena galopus ATCC 62051]